MTKEELTYAVENYTAEDMARASIMAHKAFCFGVFNKERESNDEQNESRSN